VRGETKPERDDRKKGTKYHNRCPPQRSDTDRTILEKHPDDRGLHAWWRRALEIRPSNAQGSRSNANYISSPHFAQFAYQSPKLRSPVGLRTSQKREVEDADEAPLRQDAPESHVRPTVALIVGRGV